MNGDSIALGFALALYLAGAVVLGANLFLRRPALLVAGRVLAILAVAFHGGAIGLRCAELRQAPFANPAETLSLLSWMITLAYLASEVIWRLSAAGPFALGMSFLLVMGASLAPSARAASTPALLATGAISLHITAIIAAFGAFALAFCCAAFYLIEHHILKSKQNLVWMKRLPPLVTVESAAFSLVAFGFPLLTLGILAGLLSALRGNLGAYWYRDTFIVLAFVVWATYGLYLLARLAANWPPIRTAYVLLVGQALCLLLFFIPSGVHRFG